MTMDTYFVPLLWMIHRQFRGSHCPFCAMPNLCKMDEEDNAEIEQPIKSLLIIFMVNWLVKFVPKSENTITRTSRKLPQLQ